MKRFVGYLLKKASGKGKVSPTIKSVKPTTDVKGSVKRVYRDEGSKRMDATIASKKKMETGKKMMREGQKELRRQIDTGRAFKFKNQKIGESTFAIKPGESPQKDFKGLIEERNKASKKAFMGGGMAGRRFGYKGGKLVGNQKKIDVAPPFNKITGEDFKKLRERKK